MRLSAPTHAPVRVLRVERRARSPAFARARRMQLGAALAHRGIGLVYGGGHVGLMGIVADAALAGGGEVIGVITEQLVAAEVAHDGLTSTRGGADDARAQGAVRPSWPTASSCCPAGSARSTSSPRLLTWNQLGLIAKPVVLLDVDGYWGPLFEWMDSAVTAGFVRSSHRMLAQRAHTVDEAIALATGAGARDAGHKWIDRDTSGAGQPGRHLALSQHVGRQLEPRRPRTTRSRRRRATCRPSPSSRRRAPVRIAMRSTARRACRRGVDRRCRTRRPRAST